jgi:hypothetical protein
MKTGRSNLSRSYFMSNFFSVDTWNSEKIHILAAPQYKPWADFHTKKVAAYFPIFTVTVKYCRAIIDKVDKDLYQIKWKAKNNTPSEQFKDLNNKSL